MTSFISAGSSRVMRENLLLQTYRSKYCRSAFRHCVRACTWRGGGGCGELKNVQFFFFFCNSTVYKQQSRCLPAHFLQSCNRNTWVTFSKWVFIISQLKQIVQDFKTHCECKYWELTPPTPPKGSYRLLKLQIHKRGPCIMQNEWFWIWGLALWRLSRSDVQ